ncbi:MAG: hypothetical protein QOE59_3019 [Actinomycetota bacterium]|jgi:hypothetical protein|nr:hypothetical protein [Actinomycetota bacterium]
MGRHHTTIVEQSIPAPRVSPEARPVVTPAPEVSVPEPRGWRARRVARAEAAAAHAHAVQVAHAQRRARQVALASLPVD